MDNTTPLFSVIIPVYNAAAYLPRCLQSIITQIYSGFELILINDGSTDSSLEICREAARNDSRIIVIDQINQGVSLSRNIGIGSATGRYISFVDADDFLSRDFLLQFAEEIAKTESDLIVSGVIKYFGDEDQRNITYTSDYSTSLAVLPALDRNSLLSGPFAKCFKTSIIKEHQLLFDKRFHFGEDAIFNLSFVKQISSIAVLNYAGYYYFQTSGESLVKKKYSYEITHEFAQTVSELRYQLLAKFALDTDYINHIEKERTHYIIGAILSNYSSRYKKNKKERLEILRRDLPRLRPGLNLLPAGKYYKLLQFTFKTTSAITADTLIRCLGIIKKY